MIRAAVLEPEATARRHLVSLLARTGRVKVVGAAADGKRGAAVCRECCADVVFVAVRLPGEGGLALAADLAHTESPPLVVLVSYGAEHALDAFELHAADYLLKPVEPGRLRRSVSHLEQRLRERRAPAPDDTPIGEHLLVRDRTRDIERPLRPEEIVAAIRRGRRTWIHVSDGEYPTYHSLSHLEGWLASPRFLRVSRDVVVNVGFLDEIVHFGDRLYQLRLADRPGTLVRVSRSRTRELAGLLKSSL